MPTFTVDSGLTTEGAIHQLRTKGWDVVVRDRMRRMTRDAEPSDAQLDDFFDRIDRLEQAVALIAQMATDDGDEDIEDDRPARTRSFTTGSEEPIQEQLANRHLQRDEEAASGMSAAEVNKINQGYWGNKGRTMTGGSGSVPPNARTAEGSAYMPGKANINNARLMSTAPRGLDPGKTFGVTKDSLRMADRYRRQTAQTNNAIRRISEKNAAHYGGR